MLFRLLSGILIFPAVLSVPNKVIIDTDGVVDDARALVLALNHDPNIQVLAITVVSSAYSVEQSTANVNRVLRLLNKQQIPVHKGADDGIITRKRESFPIDHGLDGLGDRPNIPPYPNAADSQPNTSEFAADALVRLANENKGEITLICLGPLTNVALAVKLSPDFKKNLKEVFLIGGTILGVGNHKTHPSAEYYFHLDPEAAHIVFSEIEAPVTVIPWETIRWRGALETWGFLSSGASTDMESFLHKDTQIAKFLRDINQDILQTLKANGSGFRFIDEVVVAVAYAESAALKTKRLPATVELHGWSTRGSVAVDWLNKGNKTITFVTLYDPKKVLDMMEKAVK